MSSTEDNLSQRGHYPYFFTTKWLVIEMLLLILVF